MLFILNQAIRFLIQSSLETYIIFILAHVILQWVKVNPTNPILVTISYITYPVLHLTHRFIPSLNGLDIASILLLLGLSMLKIHLAFWMQTGIIPSLQGLALLAFSSILKRLIDIFFYALIALALMSWFNPLAAGPAVEVIFKICEPLLKTAQFFIPNVSGIDFSPLIISISLRLLTIIIVDPLGQIGIQLIQTSL